VNYNSWFSGIIALLSAFSFSFVFLVIWNSIFRIESKKTIKFEIHKKLSSFLVGLLLFALFYCDFLREYLFINLQTQMGYAERIINSETPQEFINYTDGNFIKVFGSLTADQAYLYKYIFFGTFTLLYFIICSTIMKLAYPNFNTTKFTSFLYGIGVCVILLIFSLYFFPWHIDTKTGFYFISMEIGHFFQSSLPTLLLLVSFKIYQAYPIENAR
jgi:hypothetical protein